MDSDFFDSYSITACRIDCETRYLVENCNCRMVHMPGQAPRFQAQPWAISGYTAFPCALSVLSFLTLVPGHLISYVSHSCLSVPAFVYREWGGRVFKGWSVRVGHFQGTRDGLSYCPISQLLPYRAPEPFNLYLSCLLCFVGDAPYCTPEQYKECADPALGERLWLGTVRGREGNAVCPMHRALRSRLDLIGQWLCFHLHLPLNAEDCTFQGPCGGLMRVSWEGPSSSSFSLRWLVL